MTTNKDRPHNEFCQTYWSHRSIMPSDLPCQCDGTRWFNYGHRPNDAIAIQGIATFFAEMGANPVTPAKVEDDVARDARLGSLLHVWDYDNPEDGHWDNIEEFLHDTTPNVGETVRLNLASPLDDVEVEMIEVGKSGEPIRWVVRDVKTGAVLSAAQAQEGKP